MDGRWKMPEVRRMELIPPIILGRRPNDVLGLSLNDRTILFLMILLIRQSQWIIQS